MGKAFSYRARDSDGILHTGELRAASKREAAAVLCGEGYFITALREKGPSMHWAGCCKILRGDQTKEVAGFCRQLAVLLRSGVPLLSALDLLQKEAKGSAWAVALRDVHESVRQGSTLADAIRRQARMFPAMLPFMAEAGEASGVLEEVLERMAMYLEKEARFKGKIHTALLYPAVVLTFAALAILVLLVYVLPVFASLYEGLQVELPPTTQALLYGSALCRSHGAFILVGFVGAAVFLRYLYGLPQLRSRVDRLVFAVPAVGPLLLKLQVARWTRMLGALLKSGVPILTAMEVVKNLSGNRALTQALDKAQRGMQGGAALSEALRAQGWFPSLLLQMIAVGEESGKLEFLLLNIADFYEEETDEAAERFAVLLEPFLTAFLGIVVGGIVLAMALPIFDSVVRAAAW